MLSSQFTAFKELYGIHQCIRCGKDTTDVNHHLYCEKCWWRNKLSQISRALDKESNEKIWKQMEERRNVKR